MVHVSPVILVGSKPGGGRSPRHPDSRAIGPASTLPGHLPPVGYATSTRAAVAQKSGNTTSVELWLRHHVLVGDLLVSGQPIPSCQAQSRQLIKCGFAFAVSPLHIHDSTLWKSQVIGHLQSMIESVSDSPGNKRQHPYTSSLTGVP